VGFAEYGQAAEALCWAVPDSANVHDGLKVLDIGCGFGSTANVSMSDIRA
jgi:cyclopropane fatty-acyl-phospholipid synthase-like methyltransferase